MMADSATRQSRVQSYSGARTVLGIFTACVVGAALTLFLPHGGLYFVLSIGILLCIYGAYLLMEAGASYQWVQTEGQIRTVRTAREHDFTQDEPLWRVAIEYIYERKGETFVGRRIRFSPKDEKFLDESEAKALAAKYPAGANVVVLVNPRSPKAAVLEPGISKRVASHYYGVIGSGVVVSAVSLAILWLLAYRWN